MNQHLSLKYGKFLSKIIPTQNIQLFKNELILVICSKKLIQIILFLKNHTNCQYKILTSISGVDYPEKKIRIEISYELLSVRYNNRMRIKTYVDEITSIESITSIYNSADWWEREIWDLFGIFFDHHPDLRRILTDYGFEGHPLRKDFPLSGYVEVRYDERQKRVICESLELAQEFRTFDFLSPWCQSIDLLQMNKIKTFIK